MHRRYLIFLFVFIFLPLTAFASGSVFDRLPRDIAVEGTPSAIAIADFNADGISDLAVASSSINSVKILLGNGEGTYQAAASYGVGSAPLSVAVADLNADGHSDLAVANAVSDTVSILSGLGDGTFQSAVDYKVGDYPCSVAIGDLNGDGRPDLAVANESGLNVSILLNKGAGFSVRGTYAVGGYQVVMGDLNGDGHLDLVLAGGGILIGHGDGTFEAGSSTIGSWAVTLGDFNADGFPDLAAANYYDNDVSIVLGKGDGTFAPVVRYAVGTGPQFIEHGDFNADGYPDLAVLNYNSSSVSVLLSKGNGTFRRAIHYATGSGPSFAAIADLNADGTPDLAVANWGSNVSILLGNGDGTLQTATHFPAGNGPVSTAVGDLNADGKADLAVADQNGSAVSILLGNGEGSFAPATSISVATTPSFVALGDLNADGRLDLVVTNIRSATVSILLGQGDGNFSPAVNYRTGSAPVWVTIGDLDADGHPDLAIANNISDSVSILLGYGDGTFRSARNYVTGDSTSSIAIGDYNTDGRLDLAVADRLNSSISLLLGNGDGTFQFYVPIYVTSYDIDHGAFSVATADLDADGKLDLVVAKRDDRYWLSVLRGNDDGTFQRPVDYPIYSYFSPIVIEDFDRDGKLDLSMADGRGVKVLRGNGDTTFQAAVTYGAGMNPRAVASGDFDNDGLPDLAVANLDSDDVSILLNSVGLLKWNATYPQIDAVTATTVAVQANADRDGNAYLVCLPLGAATPTATQVRDGLAADGTPLATYRTATAPLVAGTSTTLACTNLTAFTSYDLYVVAAGSAGDLQVTPIKLPLARSASGGTLVPAQPSPQVTGTSVTFNAAATGGDAGPYEYRFWYRSAAAATYNLGRDYAPAASWVWDTANLALPLGTYYLVVEVRHVGSGITNEARKVVKYSLSSAAPATAVSLLTTVVSPRPAGTAIPLKALASGGDAGPYEYRFWYRSAAAATYSLGRDYAPAAAWVWDTATQALPLGTYYLVVEVRHVGSGVTKEARKVVKYNLSSAAPATAVSLLPTVASPRPVGTAIPLEALASGGDAGPYEYRFWYRSAAATTYTLGRDYAPAAAWVWDTTTLALPKGSYYLVVEVRHVGSGVTKEARKVVKYIIVP